MLNVKNRELYSIYKRINDDTLGCVGNLTKKKANVCSHVSS